MPRNLAAVAVFDSLREQWSNAIGAFNAAYADLDAAESELYRWQETAAADPDDYAEWEAHFAKVNAIKSTVERLQAIARTVSNAWGSFTGAFGLSGAKRRGLASALGAGPLAVPLLAGLSVSGFLVLVQRVALVAAGIWAFVAYMQSKAARDIATRTDELIDQGVEPTEASRIANREATTAAQNSTGYQFISTLNKTLMVAAFAIGAIFVLPKLMQK